MGGVGSGRKPDPMKQFNKQTPIGQTQAQGAFVIPDYSGVAANPVVEKIDHNTLLNTHNLTTDIDHNLLFNYVADEHIDWTAAGNTETLITDGNVQAAEVHTDTLRAFKSSTITAQSVFNVNSTCQITNDLTLLDELNMSSDKFINLGASTTLRYDSDDGRVEIVGGANGTQITGDLEVTTDITAVGLNGSNVEVRAAQPYLLISDSDVDPRFIKMTGNTDTMGLFWDDADDMAIGVAATEGAAAPATTHMSIKGATGNVVLGTAANNATFNLKTNGSGHAISIEENSGTEHWRIGVDVAGNLDFFNDEVFAVTFRDNGAVGIGTTNPDAPLHILSSENNIMTMESSDATAYFEWKDTAGSGSVGTTNGEFRINNGVGLGASQIRINSSNTIELGEDSGSNNVFIESDGDVNFINGAGLQFGHMYTNSTIAVTIASANTPVEVGDTWTTGQINGNVTFGASHYLIAGKEGRYLVNWSMSIAQNSPSAAIQCEQGLMINGTASVLGVAHRTIANSSDIGASAGTAILDLAANDQVSLYVENQTNTTNIDVEHANLTITQIGGT